MAEQQTLTDYYGIPDQFPEEWPADLDGESSEDESVRDKISMRRYSALGRSASDRRSIFPMGQGLDVSASIASQRPGVVKNLVESNFERFVRAKATIDNVYTEMRSQGAQEAQTRPDSRRASGRASRQSGQFRNFGRAASPAKGVSPKPSKNALVKESDYGVQAIKETVDDVTSKAGEVWGPALGGREREDFLKATLLTTGKHRGVWETSGKLARAIKQRDYEVVVEEYARARSFQLDAKQTVESASRNGRDLSDADVHGILIVGRMWIAVEKRVEELKKDIWRRLSQVQHPLQDMSETNQDGEHMELISVLLELGVDENPIWVWLQSRHQHLKTRIKSISERYRVEIEIMRRRLALQGEPSAQVKAFHMRQATVDETKDKSKQFDSAPIIELWESLQSYLKKLLSLQSGLLGEVVEFWSSAKGFIDSTHQRALPAGFDGQSRRHHQLSQENVQDIEKGIVELADMIRDSVNSLFSEAPIEDLAPLLSPTTPTGPMSPTLASDGRLRLDAKSLPSPVVKQGEVWEDFAFWPAHANSISGVYYLSKFLVLVGTAASEMAALRPISTGSAMHEQLKTLVSNSRDRCTRILCAAWDRDIASCKELEDWTRAPDRRDLTKMPGRFMTYEMTVMTGMQKILYVSGASTKAGAVDVITPPPAKLLQMVRNQFVKSVYKSLSAIAQNAEQPIQDEDDDWVVLSSVGVPLEEPATTDLGDSSIPRNTNMRMLLTLSNLKTFRTDLVPELISNFESFFSVKLTEETKTIKDVLGQIDSNLFDSYTRPTVRALTGGIQNGIGAKEWVPTSERPSQVKPYVYATMLTLVLVHTEVSSITTLPSQAKSGSTPSSPPNVLTNSVLSYLLEQISQALLDSFKQRTKFTLPALMQATLDTEFIAQTMSQYSTDKAAQIQSQIYMELDRRTTNDARGRLQNELGDMRTVLKKLREGTKGQFACFKKPRRGRGENVNVESRVTVDG